MFGCAKLSEYMITFCSSYQLSDIQAQNYVTHSHDSQVFFVGHFSVWWLTFKPETGQHCKACFVVFRICPHDSCDWYSWWIWCTRKMGINVPKFAWSSWSGIMWKLLGNAIYSISLSRGWRLQLLFVFRLAALLHFELVQTLIIWFD